MINLDYYLAFLAILTDNRKEKFHSIRKQNQTFYNCCVERYFQMHESHSAVRSCGILNSELNVIGFLQYRKRISKGKYHGHLKMIWQYLFVITNCVIR
jgi:hypothetical protein